MLGDSGSGGVPLFADFGYQLNLRAGLLFVSGLVSFLKDACHLQSTALSKASTTPHNIELACMYNPFLGIPCKVLFIARFDFFTRSSFASGQAEWIQINPTSLVRESPCASAVF